MKLNFCAVCGTDKDLHQHHIEPVVLSNIDRKRSKRYDGEKKLKECTSMEVFGWLFDQGIITDDGEITVCSYHHNILHGIVKFQAAEHSKLIREGIKKAQSQGKKMGRPISLIYEKKEEIIQKHLNGASIRSLSTEYNCGIGTVYKVLKELGGQYGQYKSNKIKEEVSLDDYPVDTILYEYKVMKKTIRELCSEYSINTETLLRIVSE
jgi:DNA invertase Pin-like site-specific DNA recombinase